MSVLNPYVRQFLVRAALPTQLLRVRRRTRACARSGWCLSRVCDAREQVGWLTVLDSVPTINMLEYLPDFLDGLLNMLSDPNREIRQQADNALAEFLLELKAAPAVDTGRLLKILARRPARPPARR